MTVGEFSDDMVVSMPPNSVAIGPLSGSDSIVRELMPDQQWGESMI